MPTVPLPPIIQANKCLSTNDTKRETTLLEPLPESKWTKTSGLCPPCKGVYSWAHMSPQKTIYANRKTSKIVLDSQTRDNHNTNVHSQGRIIRGSNFNHLTSGEGDSAQKEMEARRRMMSKKVQPIRYQRNMIGTPPPIKGRRHENVQTEKYLEELFDRPPEFDACVQTDLFLQRPPTPQYVPARSGVDVSTEISEGDLFDFDTEVKPILEVLVGRTLEQAMIEVTHEEELSDLKEQQQRLLAIREKEEAEIKRLEAEEKRLYEEKRRRFAQDRITESVDREIQERVTAAKLLEGHIAELLPGILKDLDPLKEVEDREALEEQLKPWLAQQVAEEIGLMVDSRNLLEEIVKQVLKHRAEVFTNLEKNRKLQEETTDVGETEEQQKKE